MRLIIAILLSLLVNDPVFDAFASKAASSSISASFEYSTRGQYPVNGSGTVLVSGDCYRLSVNGLEIWCDGKSKWTLDEESKEGYKEQAGGSYTSNPALLLPDAGSVLGVVSSGSGSFHGRNCHKVSLKPETDTGISSAEFYFSGNSLSGVSFTSSDGSKTEIAFSSIKFSDPDGADFSFDESSLGPEWVFTDLTR